MYLKKSFFKSKIEATRRDPDLREFNTPNQESIYTESNNSTDDSTVESLYDEIIKVCGYQTIFVKNLNHTLYDSKGTYQDLVSILQSLIRNGDYISDVELRIKNVRSQCDYNLYREVMNLCFKQKALSNKLYSILIDFKPDSGMGDDFERILFYLVRDSEKIFELSERIMDNKIVRQEVKGYPEIKSLISSIKLKYENHI